MPSVFYEHGRAKRSAFATPPDWSMRFIIFSFCVGLLMSLVAIGGLVIDGLQSPPSQGWLFLGLLCVGSALVATAGTVGLVTRPRAKKRE